MHYTVYLHSYISFCSEEVIWEWRNTMYCMTVGIKALCRTLVYGVYDIKGSSWVNAMGRGRSMLRKPSGLLDSEDLRRLLQTSVSAKAMFGQPWTYPFMLLLFFYYYYLLQLGFHLVAVVLTLEQTKQIIYIIHKWNNTKTQYKPHKTQ